MSAPEGLQRNSFSGLDAFNIVVGCIVGTGIFMSPGIVLRHAGSTCASLLVWILAAIVSLFGALVYAELGTKFPKAGAEVNYYQSIFGSRFGYILSFSYTWTILLIVAPAGNAILSLTFSKYMYSTIYVVDHLHHKDSYESHTIKLAMLALLGICAVNCFKTSWASKLQGILLVFKFTAIALVFTSSLVFIVKTGTQVLESNVVNCWSSTQFSGLGFAMISALWAFDGWVTLNSLTEELTNANKTLPRVLTLGITFVAVVYIIVNMSYLTVLPKDELANSLSTAFIVVKYALGNFASRVVSLCISLSALGSLNSGIISLSRRAYGCAEAKLLPQVFTRLTRHSTPYIAILFVGCVSMVFLLITMDILLSLVGVSAWIFYACSAFALLVSRYYSIGNHDDDTSVYTITYFPWIPATLIIASIIIVFGSLFDDLIGVLVSLALLLLSFPAMYIKNRFFNSDWDLLKEESDLQPNAHDKEKQNSIIEEIELL